MSLKDQIKADMKDAMRAKDKVKLTTVRMVNAGIRQKEIDEKIEMDDAAVLSLIEKLIKQRKDAATQFMDAGRPELAESEQAEIEVLMAYMPEQLSDDEVAAAVASAVAQTGAASMADMGKLMGVLKPQLAGKADMSAVSKHVKAALQ